MNWISHIKKFLIRNFDLSSTSSKSEAIILSSKKTGTRHEDRMDIQLLLQISPPKGRNYLLEHSGTFSNEEFRQFLQPGQKVFLIRNNKKPTLELTWAKNESGNNYHVS